MRERSLKIMWGNQQFNTEQKVKGGQYKKYSKRRKNIMQTRW